MLIEGPTPNALAKALNLPIPRINDIVLERREGEPEALDQALLIGRSDTAFGLLRDLQKDLQHVESRNERQRTWLLTRIRQAAPQTLTVPS